MTNLLINSTPIITFVLVDDSGIEVPGLGTGFTVSLSKNGGAFATGSGTKAEIGSGWYKYTALAADTDTLGPLAFKISGTGTSQQNLLYHVVGAIFEPGEGTYILTTAEAAEVLRCDEDDPNMLMLLPQIDAYIERATGHDWAADTPIREEAKSAARMLLVRWHEDPGGMAAGASLGFGLTACLTQLEALALRYVTFEGLSSSGYIYLPVAVEGMTVGSVTGVVGVSGDQSASFESVISEDGYIYQSSGSDLEDKWFRAYLVPAESM